MGKKYELTADTKIHAGTTLHRIRALKSFGPIAAGELGGYIERETNLAQDGNAWVCGDARVYGNARVCGDAWVYGNAQVNGNAWVYGDARVYGDAWVYGDAQVHGDARVYGNAQVSGNAQVYGGKHIKTVAMASRSDGWTFAAYMAPELRITAGCRNFSWAQAVAHWGGPQHYMHAESMLIINYLKAKVEQDNAN